MQVFTLTPNIARITLHSRFGVTSRLKKIRDRHLREIAEFTGIEKRAVAFQA